jgi:hypothetical protein
MEISWYIVWLFGLFHDYIVDFTVICYIFVHLVDFTRFGILYQDKSGKPAIWQSCWHLYFMVFWYILVYYMDIVYVVCTKKNLATLVNILFLIDKWWDGVWSETFQNGGALFADHPSSPDSLELVLPVHVRLQVGMPQNKALAKGAFADRVRLVIHPLSWNTKKLGDFAECKFHRSSVYTN